MTSADLPTPASTGSGPSSEHEVESSEAGSPSLRDRARTARTWGTTQVRTGTERLEQARTHSQVVDSALSTLEHDAETGGGVLGAAVAFRCFILLVPFTFVLVVALGLFVAPSTASARQVASRAGVTGLIAKSIANTTELSLFSRLLALVTALVATLWAARALLRVLIVVSAFSWKVPIPRKVVTPRVVLLFLGGMVALEAFLYLCYRLSPGSVVGFLLMLIFTLAIPLAGWMAVSTFLPRPSSPWWSLLPGALLAAIGTSVLHLFTVYWVAHQVEKQSSTYGAIGAALALLGWAYLLGRLLTTSIALNATLWHRNSVRLMARRSSEESRAGERP